MNIAVTYTVLIRRVLELLCIDRKASGNYLSDKLADLSKKGEIPDKLVGVAKNLRIFGNIGAHPTLGELSDAEVPILDNLCKAILEYVYTAPFLAEQAEKKVKQLKNQKLNTPYCSTSQCSSFPPSRGFRSTPHYPVKSLAGFQKQLSSI